MEKSYHHSNVYSDDTPTTGGVPPTGSVDGEFQAELPAAATLRVPRVWRLRHTRRTTSARGVQGLLGKLRNDSTADLLIHYKEEYILIYLDICILYKLYITIFTYIHKYYMYI